MSKGRLRHTEGQQERLKQQELRRQIAIKELQLAKMTETAQKLREKIGLGAGLNENTNPNKNLINNIQTINHPGSRSSVNQVSQRERNILMGSRNSRNSNKVNVVPPGHQTLPAHRRTS